MRNARKKGERHTTAKKPVQKKAKHMMKFHDGGTKPAHKQKSIHISTSIKMQ